MKLALRKSPTNATAAKQRTTSERPARNPSKNKSPPRTERTLLRTSGSNSPQLSLKGKAPKAFMFRRCSPKIKEAASAQQMVQSSP